MERRQYGENTTLETRHDSNETVDRELRYKQIAVEMQKRGYVPTNERNVSAPRLTELCRKGIVEPIGKDICNYTGKKVTYYALREDVFNG